MKPEQNDRWLETMIRRAVGSAAPQFDADRWKKKFHQEVESFELQNTTVVTAKNGGWRDWSSIMRKRSSKIAASAIIAAGIIVAIVMLATGDGSNVAMAAFLEQLKTKCYEFDFRVQTADGADFPAKAIVREPGKMRLEQSSDLGAVTVVIDTNAKQSLMLIDRFKAAIRFDKNETKTTEVFGFLILPMRSIEELWGLKAGNETALGKKDVDGIPAEGFQVIQKHEEYTQTISVWADSKTGYPLEVGIEVQSVDQGEATITLSNFQVVPEPSVALFSLKIPEGYTLAESQTLEQLEAESAAVDSTPQSTSAQARTVVDAFELWADGKQQKAVGLLVEVNWTDDFRFGPEHHFFTMSEQQFGSLVSTDRQKVSADTLTRVQQCRSISRELIKLGREARTAKEVAKAEKYFLTNVHLGNLLNRGSETMTVVRMSGIAIQKIALTELSSLYREQGETEKQQNIQGQISHTELQLEEIKAAIQSVPGR